MEPSTLRLAPDSLPIRITDGDGFLSRVVGFLWWKRIEISPRLWRSPYRNAVLSHESFHARLFHVELTALIVLTFVINLLFMVAMRDWGRCALEVAGFVGFMTAWSWWKELIADFGAVTQGYGPDLVAFLERLTEPTEIALTHPPAPIRIAYIHWLAARYG